MKFRIKGSEFIHETWPLEVHDFLMTAEKARKRLGFDYVGAPVYHRVNPVSAYSRREAAARYTHHVWPLPDDTIEVIEP